MAEIDIIGSTSPEGLKLSRGRIINFYVEVVDGKPHLLPTPGTARWISLGNGPIRGWIESGDSLFVVSGPTLYKVSKGGSSTSVGTLTESTGRVSMATNGFSILLADNGLMFATENGVLKLVTDPDAPQSVIDVAFMNGFYLAVDKDTDKFHTAEQTFDAFNWNALDFAAAEATSDRLVKMFVDKNVLNLFGERSLERHVNTGNIDFVFEPVTSAMSHFGVEVKDTISRVGAFVIWMGCNENGGRVIYAAGGGADPQKISDAPIERFLRSVDSIENAYSYSITYKGHDWYCLTLPDYKNHGITLIADIASDGVIWTEWSTKRSTYSSDGSVKLVKNAQFRATNHVYFDGDHLISDGNTIYKLIEPCRHTNIELSVAKDGRSYGNSRSKSLGNIGQFKRVIWRRLGDGRRWGFKLRTSTDEACDGDEKIIRERVLDAITQGDRNIRFNKFFLDVETGTEELVIRGGDIK